MSDFISLQKRADEAALVLTRDGYREQAEVIRDLRRFAYAQWDANHVAMGALSRAPSMGERLCCGPGLCFPAATGCRGLATCFPPASARRQCFHRRSNARLLTHSCPDCKQENDMTLATRYSNTKAAAITAADIDAAAAKLDVTPAHIRMVRAVESGGKSFDDAGRPVILFEPHVFHKRTNGEWSPSSFSYAAWGARPYPKGYDARWAQMQDAAAHNEQAALESASWGLFQIMGYHWRALGYASVQEFAKALTKSEGAHLDALVRFIVANGLAGALRKCRYRDAESCRDFARGYNGSGYVRNSYHVKLSEALK